MGEKSEKKLNPWNIDRVRRGLQGIKMRGASLAARMGTAFPSEVQEAGVLLGEAVDLLEAALQKIDGIDGTALLKPGGGGRQSFAEGTAVTIADDQADRYLAIYGDLINGSLLVAKVDGSKLLVQSGEHFLGLLPARHFRRA